MRILFKVNQPVYFYLMKNYMNYAKENGDFITIVSRNKDVTNDLLNSENFEKKNTLFF